MKRALKACLEAMQSAEDYVAWSDAAKEYDRLSGQGKGHGLKEKFKTRSFY